MNNAANLTVPYKAEQLLVAMKMIHSVVVSYYNLVPGK
jgi:hypothetical protein